MQDVRLFKSELSKFILCNLSQCFLKLARFYESKDKTLLEICELSAFNLLLVNGKKFLAKFNHLMMRLFLNCLLQISYK